MRDSQYYLMDGRALHDIHSATVLETCDTIREAVENIYLYGNDTCIVNAETDEIIWSLAWGKPNKNFYPTRRPDAKAQGRVNRHGLSRAGKIWR